MCVCVEGGGGGQDLPMKKVWKPWPHCSNVLALRISTQVHVYYDSPHNERIKGCNNMAVCTDQVTKSISPRMM